MSVYLEAAMLFTLFAAFHTVCAQKGFKDLLSTYLGDWFEAYCWRFIYCCISVYLYFELAIPFIFMNLPNEQWFAWPAWFQQYSMIVSMIGNWGFILVLVELDFLYYFGFKQLASGGVNFIKKKGVPLEEKLNPLKTKYFYGMCRHPLYFFVILMLLPSANSVAGAFSLALLILYLLVGLPIEERKLVKIYGDDYVAYQKKTAMFIPFLKIRR